MLPLELMAPYRLVELGMARGIVLYARRTAQGKYGEWVMVSPPLTVTDGEIEEILRLVGATLDAFAVELRAAKAI